MVVVLFSFISSPFPYCPPPLPAIPSSVCSFHTAKLTLSPSIMNRVTCWIRMVVKCFLFHVNSCQNKLVGHIDLALRANKHFWIFVLHVSFRRFSIVAHRALRDGVAYLASGNRPSHDRTLRVTAWSCLPASMRQDFGPNDMESIGGD